MKAIVLGLLFTLLGPLALWAQDATPDVALTGSTVDVTSSGKAYSSYLSVPSTDGPHPAIVLIHSFNGLENGYKTMTDKLAEAGYVTLAVGWQTFGPRQIGPPPPSASGGAPASLPPPPPV